MFYPLKFKAVYKDYIWGGRNLETYKNDLPQGIVAESWEISCHPDGDSIITNGAFAGKSLTNLIKENPKAVVGSKIPQKYVEKFPLLIKLIDANDKLSVQVHPDDEYAFKTGTGEFGKNEMWYILECEPNAKLVFDVREGTTKEEFVKAVQEGKVEDCLNYISVEPGDAIFITAGVVHAIGKGIVLAEIQQNSNLTYRVYDYERVDKNGNKRELHLEKALDVIDFKSSGRAGKTKGQEISKGNGFVKSILSKNDFFVAEKLELNGELKEDSNGDKFYIYIFTEGEGEFVGKDFSVKASKGESVFIPASMGEYTLIGKCEALKTYLP